MDNNGGHWASALLKSYNEQTNEGRPVKLLDMLKQKSPYQIPITPPLNNCSSVRSRHASAPPQLHGLRTPLLTEAQLKDTRNLSDALGDLANFVNNAGHEISQKTFYERVKDAIPELFDPWPSKCVNTKRPNQSASHTPNHMMPDDLNELELIRPVIPVDSQLYLAGIYDFSI